MSKKKKRKISKISIFFVSLIWVIALSFTIVLIINTINNTQKLNRITSNVKIPDGFYYVGGEIDKGIVISDNKEDEFKGAEYDKVPKLKGNQFVWIPVEKAIVNDLQEAKNLVNEGKNPLAIKDGENYKSINYIFDSYTKSYSVAHDFKLIGNVEPYIVPGSIYGDSEKYIEGSTEGLYQENFNKMVESVEKNKGFYISRYEIGNLTNAVNNNEKIVSKAGEEDITYMDWIHLYKISHLMYDRDDITTEMIWGAQWNSMLVWINQNLDIRNNVYDAQKIGNYSGYIKKTGSQRENVLNNIYDLAGNAFEWTQKGNNMGGRSALGGSYLYDNKLNYSLVAEKGYPITYLWKEVGTRVTMYIN